MPKNPLPRVIVDTNIWLLACARKTEGANMSGVDRQINEASASQNPKKFRGFLARMLVTHDVIVPTIVLTELKSIASSGITNRSEVGNLGKIVHKDNKADLELIILAMEGLTTDALPTKAQIIQQGEIWERIKAMPQEHRWETKFQEFEEKVQAEVKKAQAIPPGTTEPWVETHNKIKAAEEELARNPSPENGNNLQRLMRERTTTAPFLVPDYEIMLVAEAANAPVASRDKDFQLMWLGSIGLSKKFAIKPWIVTTVQDTTLPETSVHKLAATIREKVRPMPLTPEPTLD